MTSKEALERIKNDKTLQFHTETKFAVYPSDYYKKELDIIEKDLEILETIIDLLFAQNCKMFNEDGIYITFPFDGTDYEEYARIYEKEYKQFEAIKEWLKND